MNKIKNLLLPMIALTLLISCAGCSGNQQTSSTAGNTDSAGSSAESSDEADTTKQADESEHEYDVVIETAYGDLYFPDQWREFLVTDQAEESGTIKVSFSAKISEETYSLFTITIGGEDENPAGTLTSSDGTQHNVYVQLDEIEESDALDEGEQNRLYAMQEDINYLLDSLE